MNESAADGVPGASSIPGMMGNGLGSNAGPAGRMASPDQQNGNGQPGGQPSVRPGVQPGHGDVAMRPPYPSTNTPPGGQRPAGQGSAEPGPTAPGTDAPGVPPGPGGQAGPGVPGAAGAGSGVPTAQDPATPAAGSPGPGTPDAAGTRAEATTRAAARPEPGGERGRTKIADEVVEKIAGLAARQVQGVHALGGDVARALSGIRERIGLRESSKAQGVSVEMADRRVIVDLVIVVEYGYVIMEVTSAVRANVIAAVERMLGLQVVEVNIAVDDVHMPEDD